MARVFTLLYIKQFLRLLFEIGIGRTVLLLILILLLTVPFLLNFSSNAILPSALSFGIVLYIHLQRNDKDFLQIVLGQAKHLYFFHYHTISLPVYIILILLGEVFIFACLFLAVSLVPFVITKNYSLNSGYDFIRYIPIRNFEFKSGLRENLFLLLGLYLVSIAFYKYPYIALGAILVLAFISTSFYNESEPRQMLEVYQMSAKRFLMLKIKNQLIDFSIIILPFIGVYILTNLEYWYILLIFLIISSIIQTLGICLKYTFYEPGKDINNGIFIAVYALSIFVPFFVPVPLIMMVHYFRKAVSNLSNYLYDYS